MKPAPFTYLRPDSVDEALTMLSAAEEAKVLAGGQSLVAMMNMRLARPSHLVDINELPELSGISSEGGVVRIGAMTRQRTAELSDVIRQDVPLMAEALGHVAHVQVRHRGTVGGNLAHADPASELPAVALALGARFEIHGPAGTRTVEAGDFFHMLFTTAVEDDELLAAVELPVLCEGEGWAFEEFSRRKGDFALVGAAVQLAVVDGVVSRPRLALSGMAGTPVRASVAEEALEGRPTAEMEGWVAEIAGLATEGLSPTPDLEATRAYRLQLARTMVTRALRRAVQQAG